MDFRCGMENCFFTFLYEFHEIDEKQNVLILECCCLFLVRLIKILKLPIGSIYLMFVDTKIKYLKIYLSSHTSSHLFVTNVVLV